jgi:hypothetical protein
MCGVIMFTATGLGYTKKKAKHAAAKALLESVVESVMADGLDVGAAPEV